MPPKVLWDKVKALIASTYAQSGSKVQDGRLETLQTETADLLEPALCEFLKETVEVLESQEKALKRRRLEKLSSIKMSEADSSDDDTPPAKKDKASTVAIEDRSSASKRTLAARFLAECGGSAAGYRCSAGMAEFLNSASLPQAYDSRVTCIANDSQVAMRALSILKTGRAVTKPELELLGQIVLAEVASRLFVVFAAWHLEVIEGGAIASVTDMVEQTTKMATALALKDACGDDIKKPSIGDIFSAVKPTSNDRHRTTENTRDNSRDTKQTNRQTEHRGRSNASSTPAWSKERPKSYSDKSHPQCRLCKGWGHKNETCRLTPGFGGMCSKCHGKGHKMSDCTSV